MATGRRRRVHIGRLWNKSSVLSVRFSCIKGRKKTTVAIDEVDKKAIKVNSSTGNQVYYMTGKPVVEEVTKVPKVWGYIQQTCLR